MLSRHGQAGYKTVYPPTPKKEHPMAATANAKTTTSSELPEIAAQVREQLI